MSVKINRFGILDNGKTSKRIHDYLNGTDIVFLSTTNKELNHILA